MVKQCAIYFGFEKGDVAATAWTPGSPGEDPAAKAGGGESHGKHGDE
jgi:hypothetical protein